MLRGCTYWSLRSQDLTLLKFYQWDFVMDRFFVPPLPLTLDSPEERTEELLQILKI
jgi:hypothetical protein